MKTKLHYVFTLTIVLIGFSVFGQNPIWQKSSSTGSLNAISINDLDAKSFSIYQLNFQSFKQSLNDAPLRDGIHQSTVTISVPNEHGTLEKFQILEAPVFDESLSAQYPEIKSYVGTNSAGTRLRMSVSPAGVQTMITYLDKSSVFMQPVNGDSQKYIVYNRNARGENYREDFVCETLDEYSRLANEDSSVENRDANDQLLRKFRLAVSVNGEYSIYHGGTVAGALAAINATISRVNEVFETDMAVTFMVIDAPQIIYLNPNTDPYSSNMDLWNGQLQNTLNNNVGNANYDIGHMFGASGGGGNAGCIGCVCSNNKGSGITSPADGNPQGDFFDIDYVAHEIGHQMGANHTFAFNTEGYGVNAEPGSGSTVMGYAGITGPDDVQQHSDPYFHYHSIKQILDNLVNRTCWQANSPVTLTNNPPVANAGNDYTIPKGTAYVLKGSATDADASDILTYCWEQTNSGQVRSNNFGPNLTTGSVNRSRPPSISPNRYIPNMNRVVAGQLTQTNPSINSAWETVSNVTRGMSWALTVRDRQPTATGLNGQSSYDLTNITVNATAGPFTVTSQGSAVTWNPGETKSITWNVAGTSAAPINTANVNILLSTDGGFTYPVTLLANTPNDGSQDITVPVLPSATNKARVKVEAVGNIYYAISSTNFEVTSTAPDFTMTTIFPTQSVCGVDTVTYDFQYEVFNGFNETTTFSVSGNPAGTTVVFSPSSLGANGTFTMTISNILAAAAGSYDITVTGTAMTLTRTSQVTLVKINGGCASSGNMSYGTSTTGVAFGTINNQNTGKTAAYNDYTAISTDVNKESVYPLTVKVNTDGSYTVRTRVWIDWNQNCSFDDAGEQYELGTALGVSNGNTSLSPLNITVPPGATLGATIMRVSTKYSSAATACQTGFDGEVEDYTINVLAALSVPEFDASSFTIFPNPNHGEFTIKLNSSSNSNIQVDVYDIRGRLIFNNSYGNTTEFSQTVKLSNVQSGMYLVKVSDGLRQTTKKIIVE